MRIALAQVNTTVGDFKGNANRILRFAADAKASGAELVVFPELALCGYLPRDLVERPDFIRHSELEMARLAGLMPDIAALVGYVRRSNIERGKPAADAAALVRGGRIVLDYTKMLLPFYDVFDESRYFEPGTTCGIYELDGTALGVTICEDIWNDKHFWKKRFYAHDPAEETVRAGAKMLLNIASSPFNTEKIQLRAAMLKELATDHRIPVVYVNHVGGNDQLVFDGSSMAFDSKGRMIARAKSFEEDLVVFDTDGEAVLHPGPPTEMAAVYQALVLGTRDYMAKCGFAKAIVGLSGGIDSSLVATIAADALGPGHITGVSMPGPYSSPDSLRDAQALVQNLRIDLQVVPISSIFESYLTTLDPVFGGAPRDVSEENIQARIRGNILMALSNKFGALVLSTGNKSELAVGYCTLYGDMAGGMAVIGDVPKMMVYELAHYANRNGTRIPEACLSKAPTAELRPNQTDQDTLPPYEILDVVLKAYIEENLCAEEIIKRHSLPPDLVRQTVARVNAAEYKRQQAAPALRVTAKAFGMGRRWPIAQKWTE